MAGAQGAEHVGGVRWKLPPMKHCLEVDRISRILAVGLGYLLGKTLPPFFRSRTAEIQKDIAEAQKIKREAEARAAKWSAPERAGGGNRESSGRRARAEMEQEAARIREETARQIERLQQQAEQEIETAGKAARRELKGITRRNWRWIWRSSGSGRGWIPPPKTAWWRIS